jgi:CPA2 family monovalent cation:H+ antiporter-2
MHDLPVLTNITVALIVAFIGGMVARRLGLPTIVGYLLAGIAISPFTPGYIGDSEILHQLAELGVIFLMFGVGLHFSFGDLWRVRDVALPGALLQTSLATLLGFGLSQAWGWTAESGVILGLAISVASTVVLLRGLTNLSLLNTPPGQAAVGWLVMEDILSVLILVVIPILGGAGGGFRWQALALTIAKALAFMAIMYFAGRKFIPWLLDRIAHTGVRELFILAILAITLGTSLGAAELFGVSLALGAFVAGAIISQTHMSHQIAADVFTFQETFSILFFVSIGMLVDPAFIWTHLGPILALSALVILGKAAIVILLKGILRKPLQTLLVVAVGLSQIGEFSFIIGQAGLNQGLISYDQYSLLLAAALLSISVNPFMYRLLPWLERTLARLPGYREPLPLPPATLEPAGEGLAQHVVIVGYGQTGRHLVSILQELSIPVLVIEADPRIVNELNRQGLPALFGDAGNSQILEHAHLEQALSIVVTVPDETTTTMIVPTSRRLSPTLPILCRASTSQGAHNLSQLGASHIIQPELECELEFIFHTLIGLDFPLQEVHDYVEAIRQGSSAGEALEEGKARSLYGLLRSVRGIEVHWYEVDETSPLVAATLAEANVRARTGASVVAILRNQRLIANPKSMTVFQIGDRVGVIGERESLELFEGLV